MFVVDLSVSFKAIGYDMNTRSKSVKMKRPTKQLLADTARKFLASEGPKNMTMEDIVSQIGIRPSACYKHYANKQEIMSAAINDQFAALSEKPKATTIKQSAALIARCSLDSSTRPEIISQMKKLKKSENGPQVLDQVQQQVNKLIFG